MKKLRIYFFAIAFGMINSCSNNEDPTVDPTYYDQDENCSDMEIQRGICLDLDGRILVQPSSTFKYSFNTYNHLTPIKINWETSNNEMKIISGQGTTGVTILFSKKFTSGKVIVSSTFINKLSGQSSGSAKSILEISKL
jgi:hypothetical protein